METEQKIKKYEFTYWLNPEIAKQDLENAINEISKTIDKMGGKIIDEREVIRDYFAYPIKHHNEGFLKITLINFPTNKMEELSKNLKLNNNVLRYSLEQSEIIQESIKTSEAISPTITEKNNSIGNIHKKTVKEETVINGPKHTKDKIEHKISQDISLEPNEYKSSEEKDNKIKLEDVDKKLEEILGHEL